MSQLENDLTSCMSVETHRSASLQMYTVRICFFELPPALAGGKYLE
jgi:hypothetical protein